MSRATDSSDSPGATTSFVHELENGVLYTWSEVVRAK